MHSKLKLDEKYSAEDVLKLMKNFCRVNTGDGEDFKVSALQNKTQCLLGYPGSLLRENYGFSDINKKARRYNCIDSIKAELYLPMD